MPDIPKVILLVESSRSFGRGILRGVAKYSKLRGPWAFYNEPGGQERLVPRLDHWHANGIITRVTDVKRARKIFPKGIPIIAIGIKQTIPDCANIVADEENIGRIASEHLLERGFRNFAFCGFDDEYWSQRRSDSFNKHVKMAGCDVHRYYQPRRKSDCCWDIKQTFMAKWLKSLPKPVALMAANDDRARHVIEACKIAQLRVPDDIAVLGVDNDELVCELSDPPLSSIALNLERAGYEAAGLLGRMMKQKKLTNRTIVVKHTHVVTRQSTNIFAIDDPEVVKAIRYIRNNSRKIIGVDDVVDATAISRRLLYDRFKKALGRSILDEIRKTRVNEAAKMLVETNLSVSQIAAALGYFSVANISRYFRHEKNMSPLEYRKKYGTA